MESGVGEVGTDFEFVDLPDLLIEFGRVDPIRNAFAVLFNLIVVAEGLVDLHLHGICDIVKFCFIENLEIFCLTQLICFRTHRTHDIVDNYCFIRVFYFVPSFHTIVISKDDLENFGLFQQSINYVAEVFSKNSVVFFLIR